MNMEEQEEFSLDSDLERLLDAKKISDKLEILYCMRNRLTKEMLSTICISMDIVLTSEEVDEQYEELRAILLTMGKFEGDRLR